MKTSADTCIHCQLPIPPNALIVDEIDGITLQFCCRGCQGVYRIISGAGLKEFYAQRTWTDKGLPEGVFDSVFTDSSLDSHVIILDETSAEIQMIIQGVQCSSCIWLLEKILSKDPGVIQFRINYSTHRALVKYNPQITSPPTIFSKISALGYLPQSFSRDTAQQVAEREQKSLLIRFGTAAFLSMQLMGFSFALYGAYFHGIDMGMRQLLQYISAVLATPVVFYSGWPFLTGAWRSLKNRTVGMDVLISLGVCTAYIYSIISLVEGGEIYFDTCAMIITLILLGRLFESTARHRSIAGIDKLLKLAPDTATRLRNDAVEVVASSSLVPGDNILVRAGERFPVDSCILNGESELDESSITGEPLPVLRQSGDEVAAGTLNLTAALKLQVLKAAEESFLARMVRLVDETQNRKAPIQSLADKVATVFVPFVTIVAISTWLYWYHYSQMHSVALLNALAVLVVACPCALGLATPTAVLAASANACGRGILFRGGDVIEATAKVKLICFDKTGTLTRGQPTVQSVTPAPGKTEQDLLKLASQAESSSTHPLAKAIVNRARLKGIDVKPIAGAVTVPGRGVKLAGSDGEIYIGSRSFLNEQNVELPEPTPKSLTEVHVSLRNEWQGTLFIDDPLREEAYDTVSKLHILGLSTVLLTGDNRKTAERVCKDLVIQDYEANMNPGDKASWIDSRKKLGTKVMMVGDGINDAPALATADIGCAMAGGTDIALETSDLVLTRPNLSRLHDSVLIALKTMGVIKQNLFWAFSYNLVTIPMAASGKLAPVWAAFAMACSSILVVGNSLRLGRKVRHINPKLYNDNTQN